MTFASRPTGTALLAAALVAVVLWPTAAGAKGPVPLSPEPQDGFMVGAETAIEVGLDPISSYQPAAEMIETLGWDLEVPWMLLAVERSPATDDFMAAALSFDELEPPAGLFADAEVLQLVYDGDGSYTTAFRPPAAGDWLLVLASGPDQVGSWHPLRAMRLIEVAEEPPPPAAADTASASAPRVRAGLVAGAVLVLAAAFLLWRRPRVGAAEPMPGPARS